MATAAQSFDQRAEQASWVRLVNLRGGVFTFRPPYDNPDLAAELLAAPDFSKVPRSKYRLPERGVEVPYLGVTPWVPRSYAELHLKRAAAGRAMLSVNAVALAGQNLQRIIAPPPGVELVKRTYLGKEINACVGQGTETTGTAQLQPVEVRLSPYRPAIVVPRLYHSVSQALDHIALMRTADAVRAYISVDRRPLVQEMGHRMITWIALVEQANSSPDPQKARAALKPSDIDRTGYR
jgi:hypothetical protein